MDTEFTYAEISMIASMSVIWQERIKDSIAEAEEYEDSIMVKFFTNRLKLAESIEHKATAKESEFEK